MKSRTSPGKHDNCCIPVAQCLSLNTISVLPGAAALPGWISGDSSRSIRGFGMHLLHSAPVCFIIASRDVYAQTVRCAARVYCAALHWLFRVHSLLVCEGQH